MYKVIDIQGTEDFETFLIGHNITIGTRFSIRFASKLYNLTTIDVNHKTISLRNDDFKKIKWEIVK